MIVSGNWGGEWSYIIKWALKKKMCDNLNKIVNIKLDMIEK